MQDIPRSQLTWGDMPYPPGWQMPSRELLAEVFSNNMVEDILNCGYNSPTMPFDSLVYKLASEYVPPHYKGLKPIATRYFLETMGSILSEKFKAMPTTVMRILDKTWDIWANPVLFSQHTYEEWLRMIAQRILAISKAGKGFQDPFHETIFEPKDQNWYWKLFSCCCYHCYSYYQPKWA